MSRTRPKVKTVASVRGGYSVKYKRSSPSTACMYTFLTDSDTTTHGSHEPIPSYTARSVFRLRNESSRTFRRAPLPAMAVPGSGPGLRQPPAGRRRAGEALSVSIRHRWEWDAVTAAARESTKLVLSDWSTRTGDAVDWQEGDWWLFHNLRQTNKQSQAKNLGRLELVATLKHEGCRFDSWPWELLCGVCLISFNII